MKNYNYAFIFYDVNELRVARVFKICKKYFTHYQKSVFRGEVTTAKLIKFKNEINKIIDKKEDFICIIKVMNENSFEQEVLGNQKENGESLIL